MAFFEITGPNKGKDAVYVGVEFVGGIAEVPDVIADKVENMLTSHYACKRSDKKPTKQAAKKKVAEA